MKTVCAVEEGFLESGVPVLRTFGIGAPLYFDVFSSFASANTTRNALRARLAAA